MTYTGTYLTVGRWLGWCGWAAVIAVALWLNDRRPFTDQALIVLCWPILAGLTIRPLIKFLWPLWLALGVGEAIWPHTAIWSAFYDALKSAGFV